MSAELIATLAVGVALGGVLLTSLRGMSERLGKVEERLGTRRAAGGTARGAD